MPMRAERAPAYAKAVVYWAGTGTSVGIDQAVVDSKPLLITRFWQILGVLVTVGVKVGVKVGVFVGVGVFDGVNVIVGVRVGGE